MPAFTMEVQNESDWCWAAVAVSVHQFLNSTSPPVSQAELATEVMQQQGMAGIDCSQTPDVCNLPEGLDVALSIVRNLASRGVLQNTFLTFDSIKQWVDQGFPVCARITWFSGGAHFIALDGYRIFSSGAQQVHVQDPLYGPSFQLYDDLVFDYPPGGNWQDTYLVKK